MIGATPTNVIWLTKMVILYVCRLCCHGFSKKLINELLMGKNSDMKLKTENKDFRRSKYNSNGQFLGNFPELICHTALGILFVLR